MHPTDPVIKLRPLADPALSSLERLRGGDAIVSACVHAPERTKFINDHTREIRELARAFGCADAVSEWLAAIRPFDCFLSYIGVGDAAVTLYYMSTTLREKRPATFVRG